MARNSIRKVMKSEDVVESGRQDVRAELFHGGEK
jgi:hypothetical protein